MDKQTLLYNQPIKEKSRELIWQHAVKTLTVSRGDNRILHSTYMRNLWGFCGNVLKKYRNVSLSDEAIDQWLSYADSIYGNKMPGELKVAFLCGSHPENDVRHLEKLGIRIENIYAFEQNGTDFKEAVKSLHDSYPQLKIYNGNISDFFKLNVVVFDIVYLDFCETLFTNSDTIFSLFDTNSLSELGVLIVNTAYPNKDDSQILEKLANYYTFLSNYEASAVFGLEECSEEEDVGRYVVDSFACGIDSHEQMLKQVSDYFYYAYSAFQTNLIMTYASIIKPAYTFCKKGFIEKILLNPTVVNSLVQNKLVKKGYDLFRQLIKMKDLEYIGDYGVDIADCITDSPLGITEAERASIMKKLIQDYPDGAILEDSELKSLIEKAFPNEKDAFGAITSCALLSSLQLFHSIASSHLLSSSIEVLMDNTKWEQMLGQPGDGSNISKYGAIQIREILTKAIDYNINKVFSESLKSELNRIEKNTLENKYNLYGAFCNDPGIEIWLELMLNQYGFPYHVNVKNHERYSYIAKTQEMCLDVFTFDKCRALYDWLPMLEYYADFIDNDNRQTIIRMCIDAIKKHTLHKPIDIYDYAVLVGEPGPDWAQVHYINYRKNLNGDTPL